MGLSTDVYLDTNMVLTYFTSIVQGKAQPKVFNYLYNVRKRFHYLVSNLTKAEVFRKLHSEHNVDERECHQLWDLFKEALFITELEMKELDMEEVAVLVAQRLSTRGMIINTMHLLFAKHNGFIVLTGDKPLKERFKAFYTSVLDYDEFLQYVIYAIYISCLW